LKPPAWLSRPAPRTVRGAAVRLVVAAVVLVVAYTVVANVLLGGGRLGRMLGKHPERFRLTYASASSWWFGRVHVEGLDIRLRDEKLEWELHIDRADATLALQALLAHRFHATRIEAHGVSFRMRLRREEAALTPDELARLPPIDGFPAAPIAGVPALPPPDPDSQPFVIDLDGLDLHEVREVWLDAFRLTGDLTLRGAFTVAPKDHFEVRPTHVEVRDATLSTGEDVVVGSVQGPLDARIDPVPQAEGTPQGVLRRVSSRSTLEGKVGGIAFLRHYLPPTVAPSGGEGTFRGALVVDHGVVTEESTSHVEQGPWSLALEDGLRVTARSTTDVSAASSDAGRSGHVAIALVDVVLAGRDGKAAATSASMALEGSLDETDLAVKPRDVHYAWDAPKTAVEDLRVVNLALAGQRDFLFEWGKATVATKGSGSLRGLKGRATIESAATTEIEGAYLSSRVVAKLAVAADFVEAREVVFSGTTLDVSDVAVGKAKPREAWTSHVELEKAVVHARPGSVDLAVKMTATDGRPALDLYAAMEDVSPATRTALAIVPDAAIDSATANLAGACRIHAASKVMSLRDLDVRGAGSRVRGMMSKRGDAKTGAFLFEAGPVSIGLAFDAGGARPIVAGATDWFTHLPPQE
jgi:hypothetical protein